MQTNPYIVIVDDEPDLLERLRDAVERRYGADYQVAAHTSGSAALADLERIREARGQVALVVADHRMPEIEGIDVLVRAHEIHPEAQRGLLVDWGDRAASSTILHGCAFGRLENYLRKPWSPPEIHLYPALGEFLAEWTRQHGPRLEIVRVVGDDADPRAREIVELLHRSGIPHGFYAATSRDGEGLLRRVGVDRRALPAVILLDGRALTDPSNAEIADALGATDAHGGRCDVAIIGAGPAGLAAAVYAASEGLRTIVVERETIGGQAGTSSLIRNYLGFPRGISGSELAQRAYEQAWLFEAKFVFAQEVVRLEAGGEDRILTLSDGRTLAARAVLIATGATYRRLGVPSLERFVGRGIYYVSPGEAQPLRGEDVFVIGGGNSAGQAVMHLAKYARLVTLLVRSPRLGERMSEYLVRQIEQQPNVEVRVGTAVLEGRGGAALEQIIVEESATARREVIDAGIVFALVGAEPHTRWLEGVVERDPGGYILTGRDAGLRATAVPRAGGRHTNLFETCLPGVFACGDVRSGSEKRVAAAVGEGAAAIRQIHEYLAGPGSRLVRAPRKEVGAADTGVAPIA